MSLALRRLLSIVLVLLCVLLSSRPSRADIAYTKDSKAIPIIIAGVAAVAGVIAVIYFVSRTPRTNGCVIAGGDGLLLKADTETFALVDSSGQLHPGERVRVVGKRKGHNGSRVITVTGIARNYGACPTTP